MSGTSTMVRRVLASPNEICLKGGNRGFFERRLREALQRALADLPVASISRPGARVMIELAEELPLDEVARRLQTVFGLQALMPAFAGGDGLDELCDQLLPALSGLPPASFRIRCHRTDKSFPLTSPEVERRVGAVVHESCGWPVELSRPERTVSILVEHDGLWFWWQRLPGLGGLPTGAGGRALALLSGGIDSPVAAWLVMRRGLRVDQVHFHSVPRTDRSSIDKVRDLAAVLNRYQHRSRLYLVPLLEIQEEIAVHCPPELRVLLYRRFMLRIAARIASRCRARALVTGENLSQVASQTVENLGAIEAAVRLPVLRPVVSLDKHEIVALARRIGTYDLSVEPHADCCAQMLPARPATRSRAGQLEEAEARLDVTQMLRHVTRRIEVVDDVGRADWSQIPLTLEGDTGS